MLTRVSCICRKCVKCYRVNFIVYGSSARNPLPFWWSIFLLKREFAVFPWLSKIVYQNSSESLADIPFTMVFIICNYNMCISNICARPNNMKGKGMIIKMRLHVWFHMPKPWQFLHTRILSRIALHHYKVFLNAFRNTITWWKDTWLRMFVRESLCICMCISICIHTDIPLPLCQTDVQKSYASCDGAMVYASYERERVDVNIYIYIFIYTYIYIYI